MNRILPLGSGSDFASFVQQFGLPSVDLMYTYDTVLYNDRCVNFSKVGYKWSYH